MSEAVIEVKGRSTSAESSFLNSSENIRGDFYNLMDSPQGERPASATLQRRRHSWVKEAERAGAIESDRCRFGEPCRKQFRFNRRDGFSQLSAFQKLDCFKQSSWKMLIVSGGLCALRACFDDAAINFAA